MSFKSSERQIVVPEHGGGNTRAHPCKPELRENGLARRVAPENALDLDALTRLRTLFELLNSWDQKEKDDEK
jgi:hypothetical protein